MYRILFMTELRNAYNLYNSGKTMKYVAIVFETTTWYLERAFADNFVNETNHDLSR